MVPWMQSREPTPSDDRQPAQNDQQPAQDNIQSAQHRNSPVQNGHLPAQDVGQWSIGDFSYTLLRLRNHGNPVPVGSRSRANSFGTALMDHNLELFNEFARHLKEVTESTSVTTAMWGQFRSILSRYGQEPLIETFKWFVTTDVQASL